MLHTNNKFAKLEITGEFDVINIPPAPVGLLNGVLNTGTEFRIGQTCVSDQNFDGALNFLDVSAFLQDFGSGCII